MAGPGDPFTPGPTADPTAGLPDMGTFEQLRNQWATFLDDPRGRAALLSTGINLMQPPSFGDTGASQIGRAIGAGGETLNRTEAMDLKQQEADSRAQLREAQAGAAGARAGAAGSAATLASERLQNQRTLGNLGARVKLSGMYQGYVQGVQKRNQAAQLQYEKDKILYPDRPPPQPEQAQDMNTWMQSNPLVRDLGLGGDLPGASAGGTPVPAIQPGEIRRGYRFKGGDPANENDWEKVK